MNADHVVVRKSENVYLFFAVTVLLVTASAKLITAMGSIALLDKPDPLLSFIKARYMMTAAALVEVAVVLIILKKTRVPAKLIAITWMCALFLTYRIGLMMIGYEEPCSCAGNIAQWTGLAHETVDTLMKFALGILGVGALLLMIRRFRSPSNV